MPSCREVTRLNSQRFDRPLSVRERLAVWLHLQGCQACARTFAQLRFMRKTLRRYRVRHAAGMPPLPSLQAQYGKAAAMHVPPQDKPTLPH